MTETAEKLKSELSQLSTKERADLAYFLLHSLDDEVDCEVEDLWDVVLTRRMQEIEEGTAVGEPANKVFNELRDKYS
jgi:hypothetical protein